MTVIKHTGIYVADIDQVTEFYMAVFGMHAIYEKKKVCYPFIDEMLELKNANILVTKLITDYGKEKGTGDMLELLQLTSGGVDKSKITQKRSIQISSHMAFSVEDMDKSIALVKSHGGKVYTSIQTMADKSKTCFCLDPENNWVELIQNPIY